MKLILKYKTFAASEDFEKWQADNNVTIHSVSAFPSSFQFNQTTATETGCKVPAGIFVLYHE